MNTTRLIALLALCSAPAVLVAGGGDKAKSTAESIFKKADTNGDAKVSPTEHASCARDMFAEMDANNDNRVTAAEMQAAHVAKADKKKDHAGQSEMSAAEKIAVIDQNGDGVLTAEEHTAGARDMFAKMDTNQDGVLTKTELVEGHARMMKKHDRSSS